MIEQPPKYIAATKSVSEVFTPESMEEIRKFQEEYPYWNKKNTRKSMALIPRKTSGPRSNNCV